jgi:hypothetical protein
MIKHLLHSEKGVVLPTVIIVLVVVSLLGLTAAFVVTSETKMVDRYSKHEYALSYAEAGLNRYVWHLNKDSRFYRGDDINSIDDIHAVGDSAAEHLKVEEYYDNGFPKLYETVTYKNGFYQLEIKPPTHNEPFIEIISTGWVAGSDITESISVEVFKRQFVQYLMVSQSEKNKAGSTLYWITDDHAYGPLHTNHTLAISGTPEFHGPLTYTVGLDPSDGGNASFHMGHSQDEHIGFPANNNDLRAHAVNDGHLYNGRTCIRLNSTGTYDVSYWVPPANSVPGAFQHEKGKQLPNNGVIFVNGGNEGKFAPGSGNVFVSGQLKGRLTIAAANNIYITGGDPTNWNALPSTVSGSTGGVTYAGTTFNSIFESGVWKRTEVTGDDMLGLVAKNDIYILHYGWPSATSPYGQYTSTDVAPHTVNIHAAMFALDGEYGYENHNAGSEGGSRLKGNININGSVSQSFRGSVGTFSGTTRNRGYGKVYIHDSRMRYDGPPHFLEPTNSGWEIVTWQMN